MSPGAFCAAYLAPAAAVLLLWLASDAVSRRVRPGSGEKLRLWRCEVCTHEYVDSVSEELSPCPRCGSLSRRTWSQ